VLLTICRLRVLIWLGTISYGLYLLHIPARMVSDKWLSPLLGITPRGSAAMFVSMAIAIGAASISWLAFESQVLKLKERFTVR
jgi:peptidoglycan/LPS O-acetylase OafA/YrhL